MPISMNFFSRMMFGLGLANAILMALADSKITALEITQILQYAMTGLGGGKITPEDFQIVPNEDGSIALVFSKTLVDKIKLNI
jgi:hypothetical protein